MRIWFSVIPGHGHFFPMIPLARALSTAGHDIAFCTSPSYGATVRAHGFEAIAVGPDYTQTDEKGDATDPAEVTARLVEKMFVAAPPLILDDLTTIFEDTRPDAMLMDPVEFGSMVAAEAADIPWGSVMNVVRSMRLPGRLPFDADERTVLLEERITGPFEAMRRRAGLEKGRLLLGEDPADRTLVLTMAPPSLEAWPHRWMSHTSHPLRPEIHTSDSDDTWLDSIPDDRPMVAVTLGTLFGSAELYGRTIEAALSTGARVVAATGFDLDIEHPRLTTTKWVSMDRLLDRSTVVVHHGGWGSTIGALATGTPAVVMPLGADQHHQAARLVSVGAAVGIDHNRISGELPQAVHTVLDNPVFELNALRLRREIEAMPAAKDVVPLIERLAEDGPPILNR